jgi:hypothetical protein
VTTKKDSINPKKEEALKELQDDLKPIFERLVAEYQFHCMERYGRPFVSYAVLADLVKDGWRPTHKPKFNIETFSSDFGRSDFGYKEAKEP